jgi:hypothetical protein
MLTESFLPDAVAERLIDTTSIEPTEEARERVAGGWKVRAMLSVDHADALTYDNEFLFPEQP